MAPGAAAARGRVDPHAGRRVRELGRAAGRQSQCVFRQCRQPTQLPGLAGGPGAAVLGDAGRGQLGRRGVCGRAACGLRAERAVDRAGVLHVPVCRVRGHILAPHVARVQGGLADRALCLVGQSRTRLASRGPAEGVQRRQVADVGSQGSLGH